MPNPRKMPKREGFWKSATEPDLLNPLPHDEPWEGQKKFTTALELVEFDHETSQVRYRGFSRCRICGCSNGTISYRRGEWEWPNGFLHYINAHNVRPTQEFIDFIFAQKIFVIGGVIVDPIEPEELYETPEAQNIQYQIRCEGERSVFTTQVMATSPQKAMETFFETYPKAKCPITIEEFDR